ncbi:uncharacterized protein LOC117316064 [Pecten maximus]|uniref:uncharacterized protein LOC117316064 n=1 Tax=Pecten maximus TaxID=6579 RepID=UPI001458FBC0|nr:uncharacterized protein LOC117316064 [Pecten maximus]
MDGPSNTVATVRTETPTHDAPCLKRSFSDNVDSETSEPQKRLKIQIKTDPCFLPNDVVLVVEDHRLHVNKDLLESASPVFAAWLKKEWQNGQSTENTKLELSLPGKSYTDMSVFIKCLLPSFPERVTDKTLDIVLPLADEYQADGLIRECVKVIQQSVDSLSEDDIYIPPFRIVAYLRCVEKFLLEDAKPHVVRLASYFEGKELLAEPEYKEVGYELQLEVSNARAELLGSLFVLTVDEITDRIQQFKIPVSHHYLLAWKKHMINILRKEVTIREEDKRLLFSHRREMTTSQLPVIFASMCICDKFKFFQTYDLCLKSLKILKIKKTDFERRWANHFAAEGFAKERDSVKRHSLRMCNCDSF